ncbi:hypothetical protein CYMTET_17957 [Cymbomonas tetramitiformis]|uniref:Uncharacterized protein n=1 Tax=Cymbomonas tetramitiformis TaxID=36881 RepID=A0AAE0L6F7_9CHLO|nr:hypothetical protein CYMTET_17957 [Cymbomonas tetramitiformis]
MSRCWGGGHEEAVWLRDRARHIFNPSGLQPNAAKGQRNPVGDPAPWPGVGSGSGAVPGDGTVSAENPRRRERSCRATSSSEPEEAAEATSSMYRNAPVSAPGSAGGVTLPAGTLLCVGRKP